MKKCLKRLGCAVMLIVAACFFLLEVFPTIGPRRHHVAQPKADLQNIIIAIDGYFTEYNSLPIEAAANDDEKPIPCSGVLLRMLTGNGNNKVNPRKIVFIQAPQANPTGGGFLGPPESPVYVDKWGHPYYVVLDFNGDGVIPNPAHGHPVSRGSTELEPEVLTRRVIAFSAGPDGNPDTWEDNIVSWR